MRVAVLGTGTVGDALSAGFRDRGHEVRQASRDEFAEAADQAELVVLALLGAVTEQVAGDIAPQLAGKVVIDATNPLEFHEEGPPSLFTGGDDSLGERVQRAAPEARVVKCFDIITAGAMVDPSFSGGAPTMFYAGNDAAAKQTVDRLLADFGWTSTMDIGGIEGARMLESLCLLWVYVGVRRGAWDHAFALLEG
jgi:predicted dinucleotide-binding enzyme